MVWPFSTKSKDDETFQKDVLISGNALASFKAESDIDARELLCLSGDYSVDTDPTYDTFVGVSMFDVQEGEALSVASEGCTVALSANVDLGDVTIQDGELVNTTDKTKVIGTCFSTQGEFCEITLKSGGVKLERGFE